MLRGVIGSTALATRARLFDNYHNLETFGVGTRASGGVVTSPAVYARDQAVMGAAGRPGAGGPWPTSGRMFVVLGTPRNSAACTFVPNGLSKVTLRGRTTAAPLKRDHGADAGDRGGDFPRSHDRGPVEAESLSPPGTAREVALTGFEPGVEGLAFFGYRRESKPVVIRTFLSA